MVSLVPSLTELLIDLGLSEQLIGRTRFCIYPEKIISDIPIIGGTKNPDIDKIIYMKPDLIIANKEENRKEDVESLSKHAEVIVTDINTIQEALDWIAKLGVLLHVQAEAEILIQEISAALSLNPVPQPLQTAYFIWREPWMTVGMDTYIHDVMKRFGLINIYGDQKRYPVTDLNELAAKNCELILLSSEPYPFKEKHITEIRQACPNTRVELVNGEWFSWYGSRMLPAFETLKQWRTSLS